jgi:hypothetical protein
MPESTEALICADAAMFVVVLSARSENLSYGRLFDSSPRISKISTSETG